MENRLLKEFIKKSSEYKIGPLEHSVFYAFHEKIPSWIFGEKISINKIKKEWKKKYNFKHEKTIQVKYHSIVEDGLYVGYCESGDLQNLYFGKTEKAISENKINFKRLGMSLKNINNDPHFVA